MRRKTKKRRRLKRKPINRTTRFKPGTMVKLELDPARNLKPDQWIMARGIDLWNGSTSPELLRASLKDPHNETLVFPESRRDIYEQPALVVGSTIIKRFGLFYKVLFEQKVWWISAKSIHGRFHG